MITKLVESAVKENEIYNDIINNLIEENKICILYNLKKKYYHFIIK